MKMEHISESGLLGAYMRLNYRLQTALVVFMDSVDSQEEFETLLMYLEGMGYLPPRSYLIPGYIIIEMRPETAHQLIAAHNKGPVYMQLFENGVCVSETS